jgi:hypothetical protein
LFTGFQATSQTSVKIIAFHRIPLPALAIVAILSWLAACTQPGSVSPTFEVVPQKPETAVAYRAEGDAVIFDIYSQSGIGGADISLKTGEMPQQMHLRFHLKGLESLLFAYPEAMASSDTVISDDTVVSGETVVSLAVSSSGTVDIRETVVQGGDITLETPLTPDSSFWMDVSIVAAEGTTAGIPLEDGYFEVTPPADFLQGDHHEFTLEWIDFYR